MAEALRADGRWRRWRRGRRTILHAAGGSKLRRLPWTPPSPPGQLTSSCKATHMKQAQMKNGAANNGKVHTRGELAVEGLTPFNMSAVAVPRRRRTRLPPAAAAAAAAGAPPAAAAPSCCSTEAAAPIALRPRRAAPLPARGPVWGGAASAQQAEGVPVLEQAGLGECCSPPACRYILPATACRFS